MNNVPRMLSVEDTAKESGLSKYAVRLLALSGKVAAVRIGKGKIMVNMDSLADYFNTAKLTDEAIDCLSVFEGDTGFLSDLALRLRDRNK